MPSNRHSGARRPGLPAGTLDAETVELCEDFGSLLGPILDLQRKTTESWFEQVREFFVRQLSRWRDPGNVQFKFAVTGCLVSRADCSWQSGLAPLPPPPNEGRRVVYIGDSAPRAGVPEARGCERTHLRASLSGRRGYSPRGCGGTCRDASATDLGGSERGLTDSAQTQPAHGAGPNQVTGFRLAGFPAEL